MDQLLRRIFESILAAYIRTYPEKEALKVFEIDEYVRKAKLMGGEAVRIFVEDLKKIVEVEGEREVFVDTYSVLRELRRVAKKLEMREREFISRLMSGMDEVTRAKVNAHRIVAEILSKLKESSYCPACSAKGIKSVMLGDKFQLCPNCLALYADTGGKIRFVHRLSPADLELAVDLLSSD